MKILFIVLSLFVISTKSHASDPYAPFYFNSVGNCSDAPKMEFNKLLVIGTKKVSTTVDGLPILIHAHMSLIGNKSFVLNYLERSVKDLGNGNHEFKILFQKTFSGNWEHNSAGINQTDFYSESGEVMFMMTPAMFSWRGQPTLMMYFSNDFERNWSREKAVLFTHYKDSTAANGETAADYCKNPY